MHHTDKEDWAEHPYGLAAGGGAGWTYGGGQCWMELLDDGGGAGMNFNEDEVGRLCWL